MLATSRRLRRGRVLHTAWFDRRPAVQAFQPRNLVALLADHTLELRHSAEQLSQFGIR
jgi:hypothetical protein